MMRLIGLVQNGATPSAAILKSSTVFPLAKVEGLSAPVSTNTNVSKHVLFASTKTTHGSSPTAAAVAAPPPAAPATTTAAKTTTPPPPTQLRLWRRLISRALHRRRAAPPKRLVNKGGRAPKPPAPRHRQHRSAAPAKARTRSPAQCRPARLPTIECGKIVACLPLTQSGRYRFRAPICAAKAGLPAPRPKL